MNVISLPQDGAVIDIGESCYVETNGTKIKVLHKWIDVSKWTKKQKRLRIGDVVLPRPKSCVGVCRIGKTVIVDGGHVDYRHYIFGYEAAEECPIPEDVEIVQVVQGRFYDMKNPTLQENDHIPMERSDNPDLASYAVRSGVATDLIELADGPVGINTEGAVPLECCLCRKRKCLTCRFGNRMQRRVFMEES